MASGGRSNSRRWRTDDGRRWPGTGCRALAAAARQYPDAIDGRAPARQDSQPGKNRFGNQQADFWVSWACGQRVVDSQSASASIRVRSSSWRCPRRRGGVRAKSDRGCAARRHGFVPIQSRYEDDCRAVTSVRCATSAGSPQ
jgi:hypothetical protein